MWIVTDTITDSVIGPFESNEDATIFVMEAEHLVTNLGNPELFIAEVVDPQQWAMDNAADLSEVL
jgi:hypothetical protein